MTIICDSKYLAFPVSEKANKRKMLFKSDGQLIFDLDIKIDYENPDFVSYVNIERFKGKTLEISCEPEMELKIIKSDTQEDNEGIYKEKYRPQFHFSAKRGWLNDPNGLFYYKGQYHLFFQHNPASAQWGNMHWGHSVSNDLLHWQETDCALYPDEMGTMFSGSAFVDYRNDSGLKRGEDAPILLFYTAAGSKAKTSEGKKFTQCMAYSTDGGKTFTKYEGNPIIDHIAEENRDPKVQYDSASGKYVLALYLKDNSFALFTSDNLIDWQQSQVIELDNDRECPDFYLMPVNGDPDNIKWVLSAAADRYMVGSFKDGIFSPETQVQQLHYGKNSYATQTWSDTVDGRRLRISWNRFDIPEAVFNQSMTFPCEMTLKEQGGKLLLCANPVSEIKKLYKDTKEFTDLKISNSSPFSYELDDECYDISIELDRAEKPLDIELFGTKIHLDTDSLNILDCKAPLTDESGIKLRLLIDRTGIEIFAGDGSAFMSVGTLMDYSKNKLELISTQSARINKLSISPLKSIWE